MGFPLGLQKAKGTVGCLEPRSAVLPPAPGDLLAAFPAGKSEQSRARCVQAHRKRPGQALPPSEPPAHHGTQFPATLPLAQSSLQPPSLSHPVALPSPEPLNPLENHSPVPGSRNSLQCTPTEASQPHGAPQHGTCRQGGPAEGSRCPCGHGVLVAQPTAWLLMP